MKTLFLCFLLASAAVGAIAQPYVYATVSSGTGTTPGNTVTATGTFSSPGVLPNFSILVSSSSNEIANFANNLGGVDEMPEVNSWENKYGNIDANTTGCIKVRHGVNGSAEGAPLGIPVTTTVTFNTVTPASGWAFMILDLDVDEADIKATDASGNYYSTAQVSSWFKGVFDANTAAGESSVAGAVEPPCFSAATATAVGSEHVSSPCVKQMTLSAKTDYSGAGAWFEPDLPVKDLQFIMYNLQPVTGATSQRYFIVAAATTVLPVTINAFSAEKVAAGILLKWTTLQEINSRKFDVERSVDGSAFFPVKTIGAAGNSSLQRQYSIVDEHPAGGNNYYRLKLTDLDGNFTFSPTRMINFSPATIILSPNPARENLTLAFGKNMTGKAATVMIVDAVGHTAMSSSVPVVHSSETFPVSRLPPGLYYVKVTSQGGTIAILKAAVIR